MVNCFLQSAGFTYSSLDRMLCFLTHNGYPQMCEQKVRTELGANDVFFDENKSRKHKTLKLPKCILSQSDGISVGEFESF